MPLEVRDAGVWKPVLGIEVRDAGVWKTVQEAWVRDGGTWKLFFSNAFTVDAPPIYNSRVGTGVVSGSTTVFVSGGVPPYQYTFSRQFGATFSSSHSGPSSPTLTLSTTVPAGNSAIGTWRVTVLDGASNSIFADFPVELEAF
jgi:hypothetical protein